LEKTLIKVHPDDNVVITLKPRKQGETISVDDKIITLISDIPVGHKIAIKNLNKNNNVFKYGSPIGKVTEDVKAGDWVHSHNMKTNLEGLSEYKYHPIQRKIKLINTHRTFKGYVRENGEVGVRNEIWVINTVGCINKTAEILVKIANQTYHHQNLDGIYSFPHPFGCSQLGDDLHNTQKILANLVRHPNAAGVLVIGLGCENNNLSEFKKVIGDYDEKRVKFLSIQSVDDELEAGLKLIGELVDYAVTFSRQDVPVSKLIVGLKCGGSDSLSGITANPLVGKFSDELISQGGTTILTEVPEMFGAEHLLMQRVESEEVFKKMVQLINGFKEYFIEHKQPIYENPSPGNKDGGITTLEEKSLGCIQKGGFANIVDVIPYGERVTKNGLNVVQGPGNDLVSVTALTAAGAQIVLFTTGRGTPFGGPVPTVKISTNTALFNKKKNWIDYDAGQLAGITDLETLEKDFFDYIISLASGEKRAKNELYGFKEIAIFKDGVTL
jgi:altronate hydrolase